MNYEGRMREKINLLSQKERVRILAIETSCDETAAAIVENGRAVIANVVSSQIELHALYGGVVPEIASRMHIEAVSAVVDQALKQAGMRLEDVDALAVTYGPGLVGALLTGVAAAKAMAYGLDLPLIPVNHIEGHVSANYLQYPDLEPPMVCLVVSGGHTHLIKIDEYAGYSLLGQTVDDAAGEAFDKVARVLNIPYPGGPLLDKIAEEGDDAAYKFPRAQVSGRYNFSFSGLKTAVINMAHKLKQQGEEIRTADFAASFRKVVVDSLVQKAVDACLENDIKKLALAGGVAANKLLRRKVVELGGAAGLYVFVPPLELCTDNAAMIGSAAYYQLKKGNLAQLDLNAIPTLKLIE